MKRFFCLLLISVSILSGCKPSIPQLKTGTWRGVLEVQGQQLPFNFDVEEDSLNGWDIILKNGEERLRLDEVEVQGDSINIVLHVFDAYLRAVVRGDSLIGLFNLNYNPTYKVPFKAAFNQNFRFAPLEKNSAVDFTGTYDVQFFNEKDTVKAIGIFKQKDGYAGGSFLTSTGDYRYLEGSVINDTLHLSTFDGNHAYLFYAVKTSDSTLHGGHWLGKSRYRTWVGVKNEHAKLTDQESLTYLKEGYERIEFKFPDVNGDTVRWSDEKFKNKVVILQLFGTWCPNCMDETKFLASWYLQNKDRGVEILGLAYERKTDFTYASGRVKKMINKWNVPYDFVIAGVNDNAKAAETLPALNRVVAFPTTIFIGKDGKVKHIHTGFEGPGTGIYHEQFKQRFNEIVNELLSEDLTSLK
jgi:thiol-disulfide isomerase/thioredoxin